MRNLNVALLAAPDYQVPPEDYGGTQRGVHDLAESLGAKGHNMYVLAGADSKLELPNVTLIPTHDVSFKHDPNLTGDKVAYAAARMKWEEIVTSKLGELARSGRMDLVNLRCHNPTLLRNVYHEVHPLAAVVQSIGSAIAQSAMHEYLLPGVTVTAHTHAHKESLGGSDRIQVMPYGVDVSKLPPVGESLSRSDEEPSLAVLKALKDRGQDYLLHLATIDPTKGQKTSIEIAKKAGIPIIIAGEPSDLPQGAVSREYYAKEIKPLVDGATVIEFGGANEAQKNELNHFARATLFCSGLEDPNFQEPFGRVIAESLGCEAPVIGYKYGSLPELISDGEVGFGFDTVEEAVKAVGRLDEIDRRACVEHAKTQLSVERFSSGMEALFNELVQQKAA